MLHNMLRAAAGQKIVFGEWATYPDGLQPQDFTRIYSSEDVWTVDRANGLLDCIPTVNDRAVLVADGVSLSDVRVVARKVTTSAMSGTGLGHGGVCARATGSSGNESYITCTIEGDNYIRARWYTNGTFIDSESFAKSFSANTEYDVKLEVQGSTLRVKIWLSSNAEPSAWDINTIVTGLPFSGSIGLSYILGGYNYSFGNLEYTEL